MEMRLRDCPHGSIVMVGAGRLWCAGDMVYKVKRYEHHYKTDHIVLGTMTRFATLLPMLWIDGKWVKHPHMKNLTKDWSGLCTVLDLATPTLHAGDTIRSF